MRPTSPIFCWLCSKPWLQTQLYKSTVTRGAMFVAIVHHWSHSIIIVHVGDSTYLSTKSQCMSNHFHPRVDTISQLPCDPSHIGLPDFSSPYQRFTFVISRWGLPHHVTPNAPPKSANHRPPSAKLYVFTITPLLVHWLTTILFHHYSWMKIAYFIITMNDHCK